jgi:DNA-binding transcriptional LysR family regulator
MDLSGKKTLRASRRPRIRPRIAWDDLRYILAVANAGSLGSAATVLRVSRTTVLRRVNAFERNHAVRLFERLSTGYTLTAAGEDILATARGFEAAITTLENKLAGQDSRAEGLVRVTTTDTLLASVLPDILAAFKQANPGITLNVTASNEQLNLSRREADVAIRPARQAPEALVGRRICSVAFAVYASVDVAAKDKVSRDLSTQQWIAPDDTLADISVARWLRTSTSASRYAMTVDSLVAMRDLCAAGLGLAALPCYLGDLDGRLARVLPPVPEMATSLWVLSHPQLAQTARIRAFIDYVGPALGRERALIEGSQPGRKRG